MRKTLEERLWSHVDKRGPEDCWEWTGGTLGTTTLYGSFSYQGKTTTAHRVAYMVVTGTDLTPKQEVCHTCDNGLCCNPAHLFLGTHRDNMHDKAEKGRSHAGGRGKLTEQDAWSILHMRYAEGLTYREIARRIGVTSPMISCLCRGIYWNAVYNEYQAKFGKQAA
ncbi:MAG: HNH endonuclease [Patescibacteria group bacterium]|nr:HNH endonuclease [Patescibacteria group bacterium]